MAEVSTAQRKALALAAARKRRSEEGVESGGAGAADYAVQGLSGANEGLAMTLGTPVDVLNNLVVAPAMAGINAVAGTDFKPADKPFLGTESIKGMMGDAIAPETDDTGLQVTRRIGQEFGAAAPVVGALGARAAQPIQMLATEAGLTAGSGAAAAVAEQVAPDNVWAELAAQLGGAVGVSAAIKGAKRLVTPFPTSAERLAASGTMQAEGVDLTAGQQTGNKKLQYAEAELGGTRIADMTERQAEQFTHAALQRAGISGNRASREVIDDAFNTIGARMDGLQARNPMVADRQLGLDLQSIRTDYLELTGSEAKPAVERILGDIVHRVNAGGGRVVGSDYQALRSRIETLARKSSDGELTGALRDIKGALDDAVERWIAQNNPADIGEWRQSRRDYRNLLVLTEASLGPGADTTLGLISPAQLKRAAMSIYGRRSYARGRDDFSDLSDAGIATMTPLPQSGTAPRLAARSLSAVPAAMGAALGSPGGVPGMVAGAVAGAVVPGVAGRALMSRPVQRYLANNAMNNAPSLGMSGYGTTAAALANFSGDEAGLKQIRMRALN